MARSTNRNMITATFTDRESADRAFDVVAKHENYSEDDVNILMSEKSKDKHFDEEIEIEEGSKATEGAGVGGALGGTAGGIAGALTAAAGTIALPGLGLAIAGPLAAALAGAGAGGAGGSIIGALIGAGIPEERAKRYEQDLKEGHIVLGVEPRTEEDAQHFENEWRDIGGERMYTGTESARGAGPANREDRDSRPQSDSSAARDIRPDTETRRTR